MTEIPQRTPFVRAGRHPHYQDRMWWKKFEMLQAHWLQGKDANVNSDHPYVGAWLRNQISRQKEGKLTPEREEALRHIGAHFKND